MALALIRDITDPVSGIIRQLKQVKWYNDEPYINVFTARIGKTSELTEVESAERLNTGVAVQKEEAAIKAAGEAVERYCGSLYSKQNLIYESYQQLESALDPVRLIKFSDNQRESENSVVRESEMSWVQGKRLIADEDIYVPAQAVYLPYESLDEPRLRNPISTGLASGTAKGAAVYRAICEIIEREAFIISYLNRIALTEIETSSIEDEEIQTLLQKAQDKNLRVRIFELPTDFPIEAYLAITIEESSKGPALVVGASAHHDSYEAIKDAIGETFHTRPWLRQKMMEENNEVNIDPHEINTLKERGLYWYDKSMISQLDFWLQGSDKKELNARRGCRKESLKRLLAAFEVKDYDVIWVDVTTEDVKDAGFSVVRVLAPEMHPLYLREKYKYLGGSRLYNLPVELGLLDSPKTEEELNQTPHPFL